MVAYTFEGFLRDDSSAEKFARVRAERKRRNKHPAPFHGVFPVGVWRMFAQAGLPYSARLEYLAIGTHAGPSGKAFPGLERLGEMTGFSGGWLWRKRVDLEDAGLVRTKRRTNNSNMIDLSLKAGPGVETWQVESETWELLKKVPHRPARLVYLAVMWCWEFDERCGRERLLTMTGLTVCPLVKAIRKLEDAGLVRRVGGKGRKKSMVLPVEEDHMRRRRKAADEKAGPKISPGGMSCVTRLVGEYKRRWAEKYGEPHSDEIPKATVDRAKAMVDTHGLAKLLERLPTFFADREKWVNKHQHPLGYFLKRVNQYGGLDGEAKEREERKLWLAPREPD